MNWELHKSSKKKKEEKGTENLYLMLNTAAPIDTAPNPIVNGWFKEKTGITSSETVPQ